jgi:hypothetical protein
VFPVAGDQLVEDGAIDPEHHGGGADSAAPTGSDSLGGCCKMALGELGHLAANPRERRLRQYPARGNCEDAVRLQYLAGKIEPISPGILGEVAQNVGQLQRAAEFRGDALPRRRILPEIRTDRRPTATATRSQ